MVAPSIFLYHEDLPFCWLHCLASFLFLDLNYYPPHCVSLFAFLFLGCDILFIRRLLQRAGTCRPFDTPVHHRCVLFTFTQSRLKPRYHLIFRFSMLTLPRLVLFSFAVRRRHHETPSFRSPASTLPPPSERLTAALPVAQGYAGDLLLPGDNLNYRCRFGARATRGTFINLYHRLNQRPVALLRRQALPRHLQTELRPCSSIKLSGHRKDKSGGNVGDAVRPKTLSSGVWKRLRLIICTMR